MAKYFAEFIGTFALVFAGAGAVIVNDLTSGQITNTGIALTFGLVVAIMVYSVGDISGAHINPAVTFGFWLRGKFSGNEVFPYIASQTAGALLASVSHRLLFHHPTLGATIPAGSDMQSFIIEIILTFFLMFVILNVSSGEKKVIAGAAIGAAVCLDAMFAGPITGASMNPARSLAPALVSGHVNDIWIYLLAPILGSSLAVAAFRYMAGRK